MTRSPVRESTRKRPTPHVLDGCLTPDARYIVVRGRLWRAANPGLSPADRTAITRSLMDARRRLRGTSRDDPSAPEARRAVHRAKLALGERGPVWWDDGAPDYGRQLVTTTPYAAWYARAEDWAVTIDHLLHSRAPGASVCPSEVARRSGRGDWRQHLEGVRQVARHLARRSALVISQRGRVLDPDAPISGPIRFRRPG